MRLTVLGILCALPGWAAYSNRAIVTFPAASSTETNFTALFAFSNSSFKVTASGGVIQNTTSFDNIAVPADFILTSDSTCATQTGGYHWGWLQYSGAGGTGLVAVLMPGYSSSAATTIYICYGNSSTTTYQGGTRGQEYDSDTVAVWHLADNTASTTMYDASSNANNFTASADTSTATTTGPFTSSSLALSFASITASLSNNTPFNFTNTGFTVECWIYPTSLSTSQDSAVFFFNGASPYPAYGWGLGFGNQGVIAGGLNFTSAGSITYGGSSFSQTVSNGAWYSIAAVMSYSNGNTYTATGYVNGSGATMPNTVFTAGAATQPVAINNGGNGSSSVHEAEIRVSSVARSSAWLLDEYTNQSNVPMTSVEANGPIWGRIIFN